MIAATNLQFPLGRVPELRPTGWVAKPSPMRRVTPALVLLTLVLPPAPAGAGIVELIRGRRELEVITVTDVSPDGKALPPPRPAEPQYYIAASRGFRDLGAAVGGIKEPVPMEVVRLISSELAKQGYLPSTTHSAPASLLLVFTWGTLNGDRFTGSNLDAPPRVLNKGQIVRFLGGSKEGIDDHAFDPLTLPTPGLTNYNYEAKRILDVAVEDFYVIVVSAYDLDRLRRRDTHPPLWTTRIAAPSLGFSLPDIMPAMLAIGGPRFGRETARPVWSQATEEFKPNVRLGELKLLGYLQDEPMPVADYPRKTEKELMEFLADDPAEPKRAPAAEGKKP